MAQNNLYINSNWQQGKNGNIYPDISKSPSNAISQNLVITISQQTIVQNKKAKQLHSRQALKLNHQNCIKNGILINDDDFHTINKIAQTILVPETEQSRKGAGE